MDSIWQRHLQNKSANEQVYANQNLDSEHEQINMETSAEDKAKFSGINAIKASAVNGDFEAVIKELDSYNINYKKIVEDDSLTLNFIFEGKNYEYVFYGIN